MKDLISAFKREMRLRNWSAAKLAKQSGLHRFTVANTLARRSKGSRGTLTVLALTLGLDLTQYEKVATAIEKDQSASQPEQPKETLEQSLEG